jgi:hypothetical protein
VKIWYDRKQCAVLEWGLWILHKWVGYHSELYTLFCVSVSTCKKRVQSEVLVPIEEVNVEFIS